MKILYDKKTAVIITGGTNIDEYENDFFMDYDTHTIYPKYSTEIIEIESVDDDVLLKPKKYRIKNNSITLNTSYTEPHIVTTEEYEQLASNVDYLMLITDPDSTSEESI